MIDVLKDLIQQFMPFAQQHIGFDDPPRLFLRQDAENAKNPLGKTAYYDPAQKSITVYVTGRHPKDVLRSLGHELVHHKQNCDGKFDEVGDDDMGEGYAQENPHLRAMEFEANSKGSMALRDFEDRLKAENTIYYEHLQKGEKQMSTKDWKNNEISTLLSEAWGFKFNTLQEFDEFNGTGEVQEEAVEEEDADKNTGLEPDGKDTSYGHMKEEEAQEALEEEELQEAAAFKKGDETEKGGAAFTGETEEEREEMGRVDEESGEDETWHQWKNEHADDDHIREMEHHLRALKEDRDYERHEAEYDHDKYEDEGMHESKQAEITEETLGAAVKDLFEKNSGRYSEDQIRSALQQAITIIKERRKNGQEI
tara:strand:+ start:8029 stop:9129 length:1101 start_codon:yes stop_codon:yes gene_type:complete